MRTGIASVETDTQNQIKIHLMFLDVKTSMVGMLSQKWLQKNFKLIDVSLENLDDILYDQISNTG
jgi:hypothetical protein